MEVKITKIKYKNNTCEGVFIVRHDKPLYKERINKILNKLLKRKNMFKFIIEMEEGVEEYYD